MMDLGWAGQAGLPKRLTGFQWMIDRDGRAALGDAPRESGRCRSQSDFPDPGRGTRGTKAHAARTRTTPSVSNPDQGDRFDGPGEIHSGKFGAREICYLNLSIPGGKNRNLWVEFPLPMSLATAMQKE